MQRTINATRKQVAGLLKATFPDYKGRIIRVEAAESVGVFGTNWSGGSRTVYQFITIDPDRGKAVIFSPQAGPPWANAIEGAKVSLTPRHIVVTHSHFYGQDRGIHIYVHPAVLPKLLEATNAPVN